MGTDPLMRVIFQSVNKRESEQCAESKLQYVLSLVGTWSITNISLTAGGSQNPRLVLCSEVQEHDLQAVLGKPLQPGGGDWWEDSSDYTGNLLKTGPHAYQCAIARVVIERNPAVVPSKVWQVGDHVYLRVVAPHFWGNAHPTEDGLQQLFYAKTITSTGQTEVTFETVIAVSECGTGPYSEEYGEGHSV